MMHRIAAGVLLLFTAALSAADWPQWRGPNRDDRSTETDLLGAWPAAGPHLLWTFDKAGLGYSGPAIVGNVLYSMGGGTKEEFIFAVNTNTGKQIWQTKISNGFDNPYGGGPRATPTVDGNHLYALAAAGDLACLETTTGKLVWHKSLSKDLNGKMMSGWGYSESVLVDGDHVICTPGGNDGTFAALDKNTGALKWRSTNLSDDAAYSSIVVSEAAGVRQYVQLTGKGVAGVRAADGKMLWYVKGDRYGVAVIPTAIVTGDYVFATADYGAKAMLIKLSKDGDGVKAEKVYSIPSKTFENHHGGVILDHGHIFGASGSANSQKTLPFVCLDMMSGKVAWKVEKKLEPSCITYAQGYLYCYGQNTGKLVRIAASDKGFEEAGSLTIPKESTKRSPSGGIWTHPVIANGKLYLRDQELLFCYSLSSARASR